MVTATQLRAVDFDALLANTTASIPVFNDRGEQIGEASNLRIEGGSIVADWTTIRSDIPPGFTSCKYQSIDFVPSPANVSLDAARQAVAIEG